MIKQEQTQWCWAGAAEMIFRYHSKNVRQCELANRAFNVNDCCTAPSSSHCNRPLSDPNINRLFGAYGLSLSYDFGTVSYRKLRSEIDSRRPVQVGYRWTKGGGHVAVIRGWGKDDNGGYVRVNDPAYGSGGVYYSDLLDAYGAGVWDATWTDIRRTR